MTYNEMRADPERCLAYRAARQPLPFGWWRKSFLLHTERYLIQVYGLRYGDLPTDLIFSRTEARL